MNLQLLPQPIIQFSTALASTVASCIAAVRSSQVHQNPHQDATARAQSITHKDVCRHLTHLSNISTS